MAERIQIRTLAAGDIPQVAQLYRLIMHGAYMGFGELSAGYSDGPGVPAERAYTKFEQSLTHKLTSESASVFLAVDGEQIVGFASAIVQETPADHIECWLEDVGVHPERRGDGIGEMLVKQVFAWGASKGTKYFLLEVGFENRGAMKLYEKLGYRPLSTVYVREADQG